MLRDVHLLPPLLCSAERVLPTGCLCLDVVAPVLEGQGSVPTAPVPPCMLAGHTAHGDALSSVTQLPRPVYFLARSQGSATALHWKTRGE